MATSRSSRCRANGHELGQYGRYTNGGCMECRRLYNQERNRQVREQRKGRAQPARPYKKQDPQEESARTNRIFAIHDQLEREPRAWVREQIRRELKAAREEGATA